MRTFEKPDFICAGLTKTGTTWLHYNLDQHPEVWLPPVKEMHFYWGQGKRDTGNGITGPLKQRLLGNLHYKWRYHYLKRRTGHYFNKGFREGLGEIAWDFKYTFFPQSPGWYSSLLDDRRITGDITGSYYTYTEREIAELNAHLPKVKILIFLRDPVGRLWSEAKMHLLALPGKTIGEVPDEAFYDRLSRVHARCPDYTDLVERWKSVFGDRLFIGYYDELKEDPQTFLARICGFIGISMPVEQEDAAREVWKGVDEKLPPRYREYLIDICKPGVVNFSRHSDSEYPRCWLENYDKDLVNPDRVVSSK